MKSVSRTVEITLEKSETLIVRRRQVCSAWCEECERKVRTARADEAAQMIGITSREIQERIRVGIIHLVELPEGMLVVCIDSFGRSLETPI